MANSTPTQIKAAPLVDQGIGPDLRDPASNTPSDVRVPQTAADVPQSDLDRTTSDPDSAPDEESATSSEGKRKGLQGSVASGAAAPGVLEPKATSQQADHASQTLPDDTKEANALSSIAADKQTDGPKGAKQSVDASVGSSQAEGTSEPAPTPRRKRTAPTPQGSKVGPAHTALLNSWRSSRVDLKLRRDAWQTHPFRFAPDLMTQLSRRVAQDCSSSGKSLTAAQYVDAAMLQYLPTTIEEQLVLAEEFLLSRETEVGTGKQASHRVSPEVYAIASPLANELREAGHARIAVHVYSGALDSFLRDLKAEGPLGA